MKNFLKLSYIATAAFIVCASITTTTWASTYSIKAELQINHEQPIVSVFEGQEGKSITKYFGNYRVTIKPMAYGKQIARIESVIEAKSKFISNWQILSTPIVITKVGQPAVVASNDRNDPLQYRITITPTVKK